MEQPLNQILYGPPGTGKTYNTIYKALDILEPGNNYRKPNNRKVAKDKFNKYTKDGRIVFTTFHQSMSYEDFVEGIKPNLNSTKISYKNENGIFKEICENTKYSLSVKDIEIGYDDLVESVKNGGIHTIPMTTKPSSMPMGVNNNDTIYFERSEDAKSNPDVTTKKRIVEMFEKENNEKKHTGPDSNHKAVLNYIIKTHPRRVLIIDEINRGNVANIFGELITLIEDDKRTTKWDDDEGKYVDNPEGIKVKLPYSGDEFGVPGNLYIIGTMNTADRSVEALDSALRRRFTFEEMMPEPELLNIVDGVDLKTLLTTINERIEVLKDREHQIGHSYFIGVTSKREIIDVIQKKVVPLLQEYFYGDYEKIMKVIGKGFVTKDKPKVSFASGGDNSDIPDAIYRIVKEIKDDSIDSALENIKFGFNKPEVAQSDGE